MAVLEGQVVNASSATVTEGNPRPIGLNPDGSLYGSATAAGQASILAALAGGITGTLSRVADIPSTQTVVPVAVSPAVPQIFPAKALNNGVIITAPLTNTAVTYLVDATVATAAAAIANGTPLYPGQSVWREGTNANQYACVCPAAGVCELRIEAA